MDRLDESAGFRGSGTGWTEGCKGFGRPFVAAFGPGPELHGASCQRPEQVSWKPLPALAPLDAVTRRWEY